MDDTLTGYGKTWPLARTSRLQATIVIDSPEVKPKALETELRHVLIGREYTLQIERIDVLRLSSDDQAEHDRLQDDAAVKISGQSGPFNSGKVE